MVTWYHQFHGHEFEQAPGDGEGRGSLARVAESDATQRRSSSWEDPEWPAAVAAGAPEPRRCSP